MYRMIKADDEIEYISYKPPRGPKTEEDMDFIAQSLGYQIDAHYNGIVSREGVIELFRNMNDDYDDWWARGLRTREQEDAFVNDLVSRLAEYGVTVQV